MKIDFRLNGRSVSVDVDADRHLLWVLRNDLDLTATKFGCGEEHCGACTVLLNGKLVRSCAVTMADVKNADVLTIEGLAINGKLTPLQNAFIKHDALQCGFCTPGMLLSAHALLAANPHPTRPEIITHMNNNLCRCGAHKRIIAAIEEVAK